MSLRNGLFNTILPLKLSYWHKALSPMRTAQSFVSWYNDLKLCLPNTWTNEVSLPSSTEKEPFQGKFATYTTILTQSCICQENSSKICLLGEWLEALSLQYLNKWAKSSPVLLRNSTFNTILPLKTIVLTQSCDLPEQLEALSPGRMAKSSVTLRMGSKLSP